MKKPPKWYLPECLSTTVLKPITARPSYVFDKFLWVRLPNASRTKIQEAADAGNILVNGKAVKSSYKVKPKDIVSVVMAYPRREIEIIPEAIPLNIVYEDEDLIVVNKPAGMVVHPSYGHYTGTLVNALAWHLKGNPLFKDNNDPPSRFSTPD